MQTNSFWPKIIAISAIGAGAVVLTDSLPTLRYTFTLWFLLVCPGMAYVRLLHIRDRVTEWTLAIGLSLAIDATVSIVMLYAGKWSPNFALAALIAVTAGGVAFQLRDKRLKSASNKVN